MARDTGERLNQVLDHAEVLWPTNLFWRREGSVELVKQDIRQGLGGVLEEVRRLVEHLLQVLEGIDRPIGVVLMQVVDRSRDRVEWMTVGRGLAEISTKRHHARPRCGCKWIRTFCQARSGCSDTRTGETWLMRGGR